MFVLRTSFFILVMFYSNTTIHMILGSKQLDVPLAMLSSPGQSYTAISHGRKEEGGRRAGCSPLSGVIFQG